MSSDRLFSSSEIEQKARDFRDVNNIKRTSKVKG